MGDGLKSNEKANCLIQTDTWLNLALLRNWYTDFRFGRVLHYRHQETRRTGGPVIDYCSSQWSFVVSKNPCQSVGLSSCRRRFCALTTNGSPANPVQSPSVSLGIVDHCRLEARIQNSNSTPLWPIEQVCSAICRVGVVGQISISNLVSRDVSSTTLAVAILSKMLVR